MAREQASTSQEEMFHELRLRLAEHMQQREGVQKLQPQNLMKQLDNSQHEQEATNQAQAVYQQTEQNQVVQTPCENLSIAPNGLEVSAMPLEHNENQVIGQVLSPE